MTAAVTSVGTDERTGAAAGTRWRLVAGRWAPFAAALVATAWMFRPLLAGRLPGDHGDARWSLGIHEHWYRFWTRADHFLDSGSYFPVRGTLGTTDTFFAQGQFYSLARALQLGQIKSWALAQVVTFLIGMLGVAVLARRLLSTTWAQVAAVLLIGTAYPIVAQMAHMQMLYAYWPVWFVIALADLVAGRRRRLSLLCLCLLPPILALSSWYVFALSAMTGVVFALLVALVSPWRVLADAFRRGVAEIRQMSRIFVGIAAGAAVVTWLVVARVYLTGRDVIPKPTWADVVALHLLPQWTDFANVSFRGDKGAFGFLDNWTTVADGDLEHALGFGVVLLLVLMVVTAARTRALVLGPKDRAGDRGSAWVFPAAVTCFVVPMLMIADGSGRSFYYLIWTYVPGMEAVRAPMRVMLLIYLLAILVVVWSIERWVMRSAGRRHLGAIVVGALLLGGIAVEMYRPANFHWRPSDILPASLRPWVDDLDGCDALIVVNPSEPEPGLTPIDAVVMGALAGVPTPQGYGRAAPAGFPGGDPDALIQWMQAQGYTGTTCVVSPDGVERRPS